jgi:hypothetical protein
VGSVKGLVVEDDVPVEFLSGVRSNVDLILVEECSVERRMDGTASRV